MADVAAHARKGRALRVAVIGVLANHKGAVTVMTVASAVDPAELTIYVIGYAATACPSTVTTSMPNDGREWVSPASANRDSPAAKCRISGGAQAPQSANRARLTPIRGELPQREQQVRLCLVELVPPRSTCRAWCMTA